MSPAAKRPPKPPPPPRPWQRAEAGRYRSADERFTLESDGGGRWFVTDATELDELGLARTTGPFATLDAAKAAADAARERPAEASPLAARLAEAAARPGQAAGPRPVPQARRAARPDANGEPEPGSAPSTPGPGSTPTPGPASAPGPGSKRTGAGARARAADPEPGPEPRTWLDDLGDTDRDAAVRARRLIAALERDGIGDAEALVRRDLLGGTPAVATRLLARAVLAALAGLRDPSAAQVAEAVAAVVASSPKRRGLPGWDLAERDGPRGERRGLRLTADDLTAAAANEAKGRI